MCVCVCVCVCVCACVYECAHHSEIWVSQLWAGNSFREKSPSPGCPLLLHVCAHTHTYTLYYPSLPSNCICPKLNRKCWGCEHSGVAVETRCCGCWCNWLDVCDLSALMLLQDEVWHFLLSHGQNNHERNNTDSNLIHLTSIVCVDKVISYSCGAPFAMHSY